jgi:hypothetical protein
MRILWNWLWTNRVRVLVFLAWCVLFWLQGTGIGIMGGVQEKVILLQGENAALKEAVAALRRIVDEQDAKIQFLMDCLTRPLPWPGSSLCPKPSP